VSRNTTFKRVDIAKQMQSGNGIVLAGISDLIGYGFLRVGCIKVPDDHTFLIEIELAEAVKWEKSIYALVVGGEIKRIGSSKGPLGIRFKAWNRDVTNALRGIKSSTKEHEAAAWRQCLQAHNGGEVFARIATTVTTPIGSFTAYMDEESVPINRHQPPLNNHTTR
jgi:hypothetical protein